MEEGVLVSWLKRDGEHVRRGEPLFEFEGDKALQEIEALDDGLLRIPPDSPPPGSVVAVGTVIAYLLADDEPLPWLTATPPSTPTVQATPTAPPQPANDHHTPLTRHPANHAAPTAHRASQSSATRSPVASPRARRVARELGVDWRSLSGSGTSGRIQEADIRAAAQRSAARPADPVSATQPAEIDKLRHLPHRRRVIAQRLLEAARTVVPVTLTTRADAENLLNLRQQFQAAGDGPVPSFQDIILKLVSELLPEHPLLAGLWQDGQVHCPDPAACHLAFAVDTPAGLVAPVVRSVRQLSLPTLAQRCRDLAERARTGRLTRDELVDAIFTVSNLGAWGVEAFTPVINPPQVAILGLGAIRREAVALSDGSFAARHQLTLSLTFDHVFLDGAPAARFLQHLAASIANPAAHLLLFGAD